MEPVEILLWNLRRDSVEEATLLLHRAYSAHREKGIEFGAATQGEQATRRRICTASATWVARLGERLVGIISYYDHRRNQTEPEWYDRDNVGHFGQFAVEPKLQGQKIGKQLLQRVEDRANQEGKTELSCDTACSAADLIALYSRLGLRDAGRHQWRGRD